MSDDPDSTNALSGKEREGSIIHGDVKIQDGDFVGRDKYVGLSGKELSEIIDVLLKHFSQTYLQQPDQLDHVLIYTSSLVPVFWIALYMVESILL